MATAPATLVALLVLSLAGLLPALALVGLSWVTLPLLPLVGAVLTALAATSFTAVGLSFLGWFVALAVAGALVVVAYWIRRPDRRPWRRPIQPGTPAGHWHRLAGLAGAAAILGACVWCLRGLATPTVGFDARALWIMRAGWLLQSHHQLLINMRLPNLLLGQTSYPPLVSASVALASRVTGDQSVRLGVVLVSLLNTCALTVATFALVESGRKFTHRLAASENQGTSARSPSAHELPPHLNLAFAPLLAGVAAAALLVFVTFGITGPFMTNGYADPIWSLAAVGAVAYGLQLGMSRANQGVALILVLVAGLSKDEGAAPAVILISLIAVRGLFTLSGEERHRHWWRPILVGLAELIVIASWPTLMRILHVREESTSHSPFHDMPGRAHTAFDGISPYLHVLVLAIPLAIVGGSILSQSRRKSGLANDWWAWAALAGGLGAVSAAYITGTVPVQEWLVGTADRVSEFPALAGWWIVAMWAVVASGSPAFTGSRDLRRPRDLHPDLGPEIGRGAHGRHARSVVTAE